MKHDILEIKFNMLSLLDRLEISTPVYHPPHLVSTTKTSVSTTNRTVISQANQFGHIAYRPFAYFCILDCLITTNLISDDISHVTDRAL